MSKNKQQITIAFDELNRRFERFKAQLPIIVQNEAIADVLENFETESFNGIPWEKRKSKKDANRKVLHKTGALKRSPQVYGHAGNRFTLGSDLRYAPIHNYGGTITKKARKEDFVRNRVQKGKRKGQFKKGKNIGQGFSFREYRIQMPARPFIRDSVKMRKRIYHAVYDEYLLIFK